MNSKTKKQALTNLLYNKHHLNHGEEIGVKNVNCEKSFAYMVFYAERFP